MRPSLLTCAPLRAVIPESLAAYPYTGACIPTASCARKQILARANDGEGNENGVLLKDTAYLKGFKASRA